ncbi:MAG: RimK family alpha-L-glutamate ligase [Chloroflexi bacterium]|nr:RimK family alpha-L-glutamate ligase [Chloroflexota bacterium]
MRGWILSKYTTESLPEDAYEKNRLLNVAREQGIDLEIVSTDQFELVVNRDNKDRILFKNEVTPLPDFFIPRTGAGTTYFGLAVIRQLEHMGVFVVNTAASIETVKDKLYTQQILAHHHLPVPKTMLVKYPVDVDTVEKYIGFPVVVKTLSGAKGVGVYLCESRTQLSDILDFIEATNSNANMILQEFIAPSFGRDLRVFVIGGRPVACMQRLSGDGTFKANFSRGGSVMPYEITPEIEWLAVEAVRILGLDIAGVDLLFDDHGFQICEVNSSPGFKGMETAYPDLSIPDEIFRYIRLRLGIVNERETV